MENFELVLDAVYKSGRVILILGDEVIYESIFRGKNIRSDNLLEEIKLALEFTNTRQSHFTKVTLTESNDSLTKNRIFKSVSLGIKDALNIELRIISSVEIFRYTNDDEINYITAYESDNSKIYWFEYDRENDFQGNQFFGGNSEFKEAIQKSNVSKIYVTDSLFYQIEKFDKESDIRITAKLHQIDLNSTIKTRLIT